MIRQYKFTHSSKSRVFLTADTHFKHSKLLENRSALNKKINGVGFNTIEEHDETLINNWNRVVRPEDNVIHLGDFVLGAGDKGKEVCIELFNKLNGRITMLFGNHNSGIKTIYRELVDQYCFSEVFEVYPVTWNNKVTFVGNSMLAHIKTPEVEKDVKQNHFVFCSHFAQRIWIDSHKGFVTHAAGHSHGTDRESNPDWPKCRRLDVGVENFNFTPLPFDSYLAIMEKKNVEILDHHNKDTNPSI